MDMARTITDFWDQVRAEDSGGSMQSTMLEFLRSYYPGATVDEVDALDVCIAFNFFFY